MDDEPLDYRKSLMSLVMAMFSMAMGVGFIGPLLPVYAETLGASGTWIGAIFGANPFVRALLMLVFGSLSDYRGKKRIMAGGLLGYMVVSIGFVQASTVHHLFFLRAMQGVFSAMISPVARAYAGQLSPRAKEGAVMGMINTGFFAGFAAGPLVGGLLADVFGFHTPFYAMTILNAIAFTCVLAFVPEQKADIPAGAVRPSSLQMALQSVQLLRHELVRGMVLIRSSVGIGHGVFSSLLPLFGQLFLGATSAQVGLAVTSRGLVAALLQKKGGSLADRYNRKWLAISAALLAPIGFLLVPYSQAPYHLVLISMLIGTSFGLSVPSAEAIAVELGRVYDMGKIMGVKEMCRSFTIAIGALIGGMSLDVLGAVGAHAAAAALTGAGLFVALWHLREYRRFSVESTGSMGGNSE